MQRTNITELTCDQLLAAYANKVFRPVMAETPAISAAYDGKYVSAVLVATNVALSEAQMDALETAIQGIAGVYKAFCLIGPARIPVDRVPPGTDLTIRVEAGFEIRPTPEP